MFFTLVNRTLTAILIAGATLCLLFIILSGAVNHSPFNQFYWLQAHTADIKNAGGSVTRWTYWGVCHPNSVNSSKNGNCTQLGPDIPLSPFDNFGNSTSLPHEFVSNRDTYYYLSRFSFPLLFVAFGFSAISFIGQFLTPCWAAMRHVTFFFVSLGLIFCLAGAACQTAVSVLARKQFTNSKMAAKIGASMFGLVWAATACLLIVFFLTCCSSLRKAYTVHRETYANDRALELNEAQQQDGFQPIVPGQTLADGSQPQLATVPGGSAPVGVQQTLSPSETGDDYLQSQGALPSNEGGIRFFKIKRNNKNTDEESL
ncbi:hypothetical protein FOA43_000418 [Brettanomyces nanus]|uniref:Uncharacterized protein n=1 Tax=Eeniella nana TaxID=13502 RepID=A0A875RX56_EENNA|nr:uncharacterized protein FOA43_000418 [Brettanomyces nanus]QPG73113.1 hypothetical protein FOA43_000418 [Brettanomyces nanus]